MKKEKVGNGCRTTVKERISYGMYFFGQGLIYTIISQYLMFFYTDYALLPPLVVSVLLFGGKVWDAVNDTLFGVIVDKVRFKSGEKFLPWLRISTILIPVTTVLLFSIEKVPSMGWRIGLALVTYFLWDTAYTLCDAPILGLCTTMTTDVKERGTLMTFSGVGGAMAMALSALAIVPFLDTAGFLKTSIGIGAVAFVTMSMVSIFCRERVHIETGSQEGAGLRDTWRYLKGNRYLKLFYGYRILSGIMSVSMLTFMCKYCLGDVKAVALVALYSLPMIFCVYAAAPVLMKRFDRIVLYRASVCLTIAAYLITFFIGYEHKQTVIFCMAVIAALAILPSILLGAIPQDCVEYGTFKTGVRKEGITFALQSFVSKLNAAFASGLTGIVLTLIRYEGALEVQSAATTRGIWSSTFLIPAAGQLLAVWLLFRYDLRDKDVQIMSDCNSGKLSREVALGLLSRQYR